jgi:hypothetical protein
MMRSTSSWVKPQGAREVVGSCCRIARSTALRDLFALLATSPEPISRSTEQQAFASGLKHSDGERLLDGKLVRLAAPMDPWLPPVYEAASGWVHLSPLHITSPLSLDEQRMTLGMEFPIRYQDRLPALFLAEIQVP